MTSTITKVGRDAGTVQKKTQLRTVMPMTQKYGPRTAEVEAVIAALREFSVEQWRKMMDAWSAAWSADCGVA